MAEQKAYHQHQFLHPHLENLAHLDLQLAEVCLLLSLTFQAGPERDQRSLANVFDDEDSIQSGTAGMGAGKKGTV